MDNSLIEMVARHEGFRATVYCDACGQELYYYHGDETVWLCRTGCKGGNLTVGYGTRVNGAGITRDQAQALMFDRLQDDDAELRKFNWYAQLDEARKNALQDMAYTMGVAGVLQFKGMIAALERQDWGAAARAIHDSKWAREAPAREKEVAELIEHG